MTGLDRCALAVCVVCRCSLRRAGTVCPAREELVMNDARMTAAMKARLTVKRDGHFCARVVCDRCDAVTQATMRRNRFEMFVAAQRRNARWQ